MTGQPPYQNQTHSDQNPLVRDNLRIVAIRTHFRMPGTATDTHAGLTIHH